MSVLRKCDIPEADLEQLAADSDSWRSTCATGLESFAAASEQAASDRRARRHATALPKQLVSGLRVLNVVESAPQTLVCAVIYASTKDRDDSTTTVHVFVDIDGLPQASKQHYGGGMERDNATIVVIRVVCRLFEYFITLECAIARLAVGLHRTDRYAAAAAADGDDGS